MSRNQIIFFLSACLAFVFMTLSFFEESGFFINQDKGTIVVLFVILLFVTIPLGIWTKKNGKTIDKLFKHKQ